MTSVACACMGSPPVGSSSPWRPWTTLRNQAMQQVAYERACDLFFDRARSRLTLDVPAGLFDPAVAVVRGDLDLDPAIWERAGAAEPGRGRTGRHRRSAAADSAS